MASAMAQLVCHCAAFSTFMIFASCFLCIDAAETSRRQSCSGDPNRNHAKVLILGAGAAGLQAARLLHSHHMAHDDFIIIEGSDYIGGRVHNVPFAGVNVELGANWAQPGGTHIVEQVETLDIETHMSNFDSLVIRSSTGYDVTDTKEAGSSWEGIESAMKQTRKLAKDIEDYDKPDMSQRTALRLGDWVPTTPIEHTIENYMYDFEWADRPEVTSLRSTAFVPYDEDILFVKDARGFEHIFSDKVHKLSESECMDHIRLNKTVVMVDQSSEDVVEVTCRDGTVYTGEYVLVTFGLGVMQDRSVTFVPPLPSWKVEELNQFLMTSFTKIFIKWPYKFWSDEEWILHAHPRRGYYPLFMNLEAAGLLPSGTNILVGFVTSDESRRIEYQTDAQTKLEIETVFRGMYGADVVPDVDEIMISGWNRNPLHRGAYSNWPVEVSQECFLKIQKRVGRLFFGGEHTDEKYNGYVLGAQRSGRREARKILQCLKDVCEDLIYSMAPKSAMASPVVVLLLALLFLSQFFT